MSFEKVYAVIAVGDFASALEWYARLLGRRADVEPMEGLAEWHSSEGGGIQLNHDGARAGSSELTLEVGSLDDRLAALEAEGMPVGPIESIPGVVKAATVTDPEGNQINFAEDLTDGS